MAPSIVTRAVEGQQQQQQQQQRRRIAQVPILDDHLKVLFTFFRHENINCHYMSSGDVRNLTQTSRKLLDASKQTVKKLHLLRPRDNGNAGKTPEEMARVLKRWPHVEEVSIQFSSFLQPFAKVMEQGLCQGLRRLELQFDTQSSGEDMEEKEAEDENGNGLGLTRRTRGIQAFARALGENTLPNLELLDVSVLINHELPMGEWETSMLPIMNALSGGASPKLKEFYLCPFNHLVDGGVKDALWFYVEMLKARQAAGCRGLVALPTRFCFLLEFMGDATKMNKLYEMFDLLMPSLESIGGPAPGCYEEWGVPLHLAQCLGQWLLAQQQVGSFPLQEIGISGHPFCNGVTEAENDEVNFNFQVIPPSAIGMIPLFDALAEGKLAGLKTLRLEHVDPSREGDEEVMEALCRMLSKVRGLECLDLSQSNFIVEDAMIRIFEAFWKGSQKGSKTHSYINGDAIVHHGGGARLRKLLLPCGLSHTPRLMEIVAEALSRPPGYCPLGYIASDLDSPTETFPVLECLDLGHAGPETQDELIRLVEAARLGVKKESLKEKGLEIVYYINGKNAEEGMESRDWGNDIRVTVTKKRCEWGGRFRVHVKIMGV
jgi:hypothetical protein